MVGMLAWKTSQGEKRGKTVTLRERELLHIRICCAEILRGPKTPESVLRRRVNTAARKLKKAGIGRVILPEDFSQAEQLEKWELRPVSTLPLRKTLAADWVRRDLKQRGIPAAGARVAVAAGSMTGEVVRTVTELSLRHRYVLLSVPYGGEELCQQLRREYGVSLLLKPTREQLEGADMVFVTCGLGGGTGTGSAPIIAKIAKKLGALTVAVATMPFSAEGIKRRENAELGLEKLQEAADTVIIIPNDKLLEVAPNLPLNKAFMVSDEILGRAVKGITELITKRGLVSLDFADIRSIMGGSGMAMIGMGESDSGDRALESVHEALSSPLLDIDISNATGALVNISGSSDLTLNEAEKIVQIVGDRLDPEANIIWGAQIDEDLQNMIRTTIVVSGVKSQYTIEPKNDDFEEIDIDDDFEGTVLGQTEDAPADPLDEFLDGIF